ncbi:carbohydrate ABC transporter permease [Cohnella thermotolerans]|uniref:carbohydrate ABC transporter permease n=1 Tax=Cohnella thermotolerans TaxID=329858 RepID=UPI000418B749|nr:carbohydrate ABC transporter permease [Cohnella thermotolerans]
MSNTTLRRGIGRRLFRAKPTELIPPFYLWIGLALLCVFTLAPFANLVLSSLMEKQELLSGHLFPKKFTLINYRQLFGGPGALDFVSAIRNSVVVAAVTTAFTILIGVFASYALARIKFRFRSTALFAILAMQLLPTISIVVPLYMMMRDGVTVGIPFTDIVWFRTPPLLNTVWALIVSYITFSLPFAVWMMTGYFKNVPKEMEEAAFVDGSGRFRTMFTIVFPLAMPGIAATSIFTFLTAWDEFMFASSFTQTYASKTLPIAVSEFVGKHSLDWGLMTAAGFIASLPPVLISLFLYRYIVGGLTAGGVKG